MDEERETQYRPEGGGYYHYTPGYQPQPVKSGNAMSFASLIVGILALLLGFFGGVFGIVMGALGIILAILSRGRERMPAQAKIGIGFSISGLFLGTMMLTAMLSLVTTADFRDQVQDELNRYGYDFDFGENRESENSRGYDDFYNYGNGDGDYEFDEFPDDMPGFGDDFNYWDFGDDIDGGYDDFYNYGNGENII